MSIRVMSWVWDNYSHGGSRLLLMMAIGDATVDGWMPIHALDRAAERSRLTHEEAVAILGAMAADGEVEVFDDEIRIAGAPLETYSRKPRTRSEVLRSQLAARRRQIVEQLIERDGDHCRKCSAAGLYHVDHAVPLVVGGTNDLDNLQLLCPPCNLKKGTREVRH